MARDAKANEALTGPYPIRYAFCKAVSGPRTAKLKTAPAITRHPATMLKATM